MSRQTIYAFIVSFILLITVIILNRVTFNRMKSFTMSVDHTREVITTLESVSNHFKSAQIYTKTYKSDSLENFYRLYKQEADSVVPELASLKRLIADNPSQKSLVDSLGSMISKHLYTLMEKNIAEIINAGEGWRLDDLYTIHQAINRGIETEKQLLKDRQDKLEESTRFNNLMSTIFGIIAVGIIIATFISHLFLSKRRKWLEGFLESILNTSQSGIVHYKAIREKGKIVDFRLEFINKAADRLLGIRSSEIMGKTLREIQSYAVEAGLFKEYVKIVDTGKPAEFEHLYKRGSMERWFLVTLAKMDDGVIASFNNISQLKKYEAELKDNIEELRRSNVELEQYAYIASHDLQEPLRKIRSFGTYLEDTQANRLDERGKEQLKKIINAAERMSVLIKDILTFSGLKKHDNFISVDMDQILHAVLQDLDLMISQKNASVRADKLPVIEAIPLQINQLFYNLINNSLKFAGTERKPEITISCRKISEEEKIPTLLKEVPYYEIIFSDNGIGFDQDYSEQIFGLFKRLNEKQLYPGSGIGLALCKKVVDNHHGDIVAKGIENQGAAFYIYLPEKQKEA